MTQFNRRHAMCLMGAASVAACAPAVQTGALSEDPFEGGIGGTGIVGLMVGAGSVLINGLRVEVPSRTKIILNGGQSDDSALVAGRAMTIVAQKRLDRLEAKYIRVDDPLVGVLQSANGAFTIHGTPITLDRGVHGLRLVGQRVAASGVWAADGSLVASLVRAVPDAPDRIAGTVTGSPSDGWQIGQTAIMAPAGASFIAGQYASVTGLSDGRGFTARSLTQGRFEPGTQLSQLSVEGFLETIPTAPGFRIAGLGHSFARQLALEPLVDQRAVFFGRYNGLFVAQRAVTLPDGVDAQRAALLPQAGAQFAPALSGNAAQRIAVR